MQSLLSASLDVNGLLTCNILDISKYRISDNRFRLITACHADCRRCRSAHILRNRTGRPSIRLLIATKTQCVQQMAYSSVSGVGVCLLSGVQKDDTARAAPIHAFHVRLLTASGRRK